MWWQNNYPLYYEAGTQKISQEALKNKMLFYCLKQTNFCGKNIIYKGLNVDIVLAYFGSTNYKENGKLYFQIDRKQYCYSILWGVKILGIHLRSDYGVKIRQIFIKL